MWGRGDILIKHCICVSFMWSKYFEEKYTECTVYILVYSYGNVCAPSARGRWKELHLYVLFFYQQLFPGFKEYCFQQSQLNVHFQWTSSDQIDENVLLFNMFLHCPKGNRLSAIYNMTFSYRKPDTTRNISCT